MKTYDLAILGSGPGGYVAGLYASRHNLRVCVIEESSVGGTCLNKGCIPTKSLINAASVYTTARNAAAFGISTGTCSVDYAAVLKRKDDTVLRLRTGIETLFRANKIDLLKGRGKIVATDTIEVSGAGTIKAASIIIATGSRPASLPCLAIDESIVLSSDGILSIDHIPASLAVVGGGVIGCEFASLFNALGSRITIIEAVDRLLPMVSREGSKKVEQIFRKRGIDIHTSTTVTGASGSGPARLSLSGQKTVDAERILVSVGRSPAIDGIGLAELGIATGKGRVVVDNRLRTNVPNIYAIGDCVPGPQLAHKASYDAIIACDTILGKEREADYSAVPNCIWTDPEVAAVGLTEEDARAAHPGAKVARFPYLASGKAFIEGKSEGYLKIVGTPDGTILGVEIVGSHACELINEASLAMASRLGIREWANVVHGHPTVSEIFQEAARTFCGTPIHSI